MAGVIYMQNRCKQTFIHSITLLAGARKRLWHETFYLVWCDGLVSPTRRQGAYSDYKSSFQKVIILYHLPKSHKLSPIFNTYYNNNKCKLRLEQWTMKAYTPKYETFFRSRYNEH